MAWLVAHVEHSYDLHNLATNCATMKPLPLTWACSNPINLVYVEVRAQNFFVQNKCPKLQIKINNRTLKAELFCNTGKWVNSTRFNVNILFFTEFETANCEVQRIYLNTFVFCHSPWWWNNSHSDFYRGHHEVNW